MKLQYGYRVEITLRRTRRKSIEYIPNWDSYGRLTLDIDLCNLITSVDDERDLPDVILDIIREDLYRRKVEPFIDKEREKRLGVVIEKIIYDIPTIDVYEPESQEWIDLDDYLDAVIEFNLCE